MLTIDRPYENLIEIKKSKFLTYIYPYGNVEDIESTLKDLRQKHKDATHVCYAYVVASPNMEKCSDDGEPDGTAGKPILDVIKKNNLTDVLIVVVRYFGGIKLGAGGLVRAYSSSAGDIVKLCKFGQYKNIKTYSVKCEIKYAKQLLDMIRQYKIKLVSQEYLDVFTCNICIEDEIIFEKFKEKYELIEISNSRVFYENIEN